MMAMAFNVVQAQTCAIANKNNGKVVQISVDLDSLKGQTLVTTINQKNGKLIVQMAYDSDSLSNAAISREDSTENLANEIVADTTVVAGEEPFEQDTLADNQNAAEGNMLNLFGVNEVTSLIGSFVKTYGEPYVEHMAKKLTEADTTKYVSEYKQRKWKWLNKFQSYTTLELSGIFGKDFSDNGDEATSEINEEDYGADPDKSHNYGGSAKISQVFVWGHHDANGKFVPNSQNLAWSIGALFAMDYQKDYGWSYDIMAKLGIQAGIGITLGVDLLIGAGTTPYAIYSTDYIDYRTVMHNQWCFKSGIQGWVSMNYGGNTYTSVYARLVKSIAPSSVYNHPVADNWENVLVDFDEGSWQVGVSVGYKFGFQPNLYDKRLWATVSTGYNLFGGEKAMETMIEIEKFNKVNPKLDFIYGLGYGYSMGEKHTNSLTAGFGWKYRPNSTGKFAYLTKLYAGVVECLVEKNISREDKYFTISGVSVKQPCLKAGLQAGVCYNTGCFSLSASLRGGYHYGFDTEYDGYEVAENSNLRGVELTPMFGIGINF